MIQGPVNTQWLNAFKQEGSVKLGELEDFQINAINDKLHRSYNVTYGVQAPS
ncbi:unnamed protein product [Brassica oleracea]